jgi:hypothetical protein
MILKKNLLKKQTNSNFFINYNIHEKINDFSYKYLEYDNKGFWGFGEIGRASCRERV